MSIRLKFPRFRSLDQNNFCFYNGGIHFGVIHLNLNLNRWSIFEYWNIF